MKWTILASEGITARKLGRPTVTILILSGDCDERGCKKSTVQRHEP